MTKPVLYHGDLSPCAHKVRLLLEDRNIAWESKLINLMVKENLTPEYLAINPKGLVPALVTGEGVVTESSVILDYLEDKYPDNPRRPANAYGRAKARLWIRHIDDSLHPTTAPILFSTLGRAIWHKTKSPEEIETLINKVPDKFKRERQLRLLEHGLDAVDVQPAIQVWFDTFEKLDQQLSETEWLVGDEISTADIAFAPYIYIMEYLKVKSIFAKYSNMTRWFEAIKARPSFSKALDPYLAEKKVAMISNLADKFGPALEEKFSAL